MNAHRLCNTVFAVLIGLLSSACKVTTEQPESIVAEAPPRATLADASIQEGDDGSTDVVFTLTLDKAVDEAVTVNYSTVDGTASAGIDFLGRAGQITIEPGGREATINVPVVGDRFREADEDFRVELSDPEGLELEAFFAWGTIVDDDMFPQLSVTDASASEGDDGAQLNFFVALSAEPEMPVTVDWAVAGGTAVAGSDYVASEGTLEFPAGVIGQSVSVPLLDDEVDEPTESVLLTFSNAVNAIVPDSPATGTILDDDDALAGLGLTERPANSVCLAGATERVSTTVTLTELFPELPDFAAPVQVAQIPADAGGPVPGVWYVAERGGVIRRWDPDAIPPPPEDPPADDPVPGDPPPEDPLPEDPPVPAEDPVPFGLTPMLDISDRVDATGEGGLLSFAFHPQFATNGYVYVSYTRSGAPLTSVVSRFESADGGVTLDPASETELLTVAQPYANHNGGRIGFGPDGMLYIAMGDGGGTGDPLDNARNTRNVLGAMLRIDVDGGSPYAIPADNPFAGNALCNLGGVGSADCPEIFAWGLRNPWQWQFDARTGALWAGDVGQGEVEEIDLLVAGGDYGWRTLEGSRCYDPPADCDAAGLVAPVAEYDRTTELGRSVTGGTVYRGEAIPSLAGRYVFADFVTGNLMVLRPADGGGYDIETLLTSGRAIVSFYADAAGELYVVDIAGGRVLAVTPGSESVSAPFPETLAATGCMDATDPTAFAGPVIPYAPIVESHADGAAQRKGFAIPDGTVIDTGLAADGSGAGDWTLPAGAVAIQHLTLDDAPVETRLLVKHTDGSLRGYSYAWDAPGGTATRVRGGWLRNLGEAEMEDGPLWYYPSEAECAACHAGAGDGTLGIETAQLNALYTYGARRANQLTTLDGIGMFAAPLPLEASELPAFPRLSDEEATLTGRARAWLHVNCAGCHQPGGRAPGGLDLRFERTIVETNACDIVPALGDGGIADARIIAPGDPERSVLLARVNTTGPGRMPPLGSRTVDATGAALVSSWIAAMEADCVVPDDEDAGDVAPPPPPPPPPEVDQESIDAFEMTLYPVLRANCASCHSGAGPGDPAFAHPLVATAHEQTIDNGLVDLMMPEASIFIRRLAVDRHRCGTDAECDALAIEVEAQIGAWGMLLEPPAP